jgi:hypothetical protein
MHRDPMHKTTAPRTRLRPLVLATLALLLLALGGCGGGGKESLIHIQGSSQGISKAMLNHWMRAMAGGDFRAANLYEAPQGLVSEPANYGECARAAKKVVPRGAGGKLLLSDGQIEQKCRELYRSIKAQALSFLLSVQWTMAEGREQGINVSEALLHKEFQRYSKDFFPNEGELQRYVSERHWVLSDVLYQLKRNIIVKALLPRFKAKVKRAGGGEAVYARLSQERYARRVARTSCKPGYVAPGCREYHGPAAVRPAPNIILEAFAKGRAS